MAQVLKKMCATVCPACKADPAGDCGCTYAAFRIITGLLFMQHGAQKLFGMFGGLDAMGGSAELMTLMGLAGIIEFFGGLAVALGLFTRIVAMVAMIEMIFAFFMVHAPQGWNPLLNGGELALLYVAAFMLMSKMGNGKLSLEQALLKKETF